MYLVKLNNAIADNDGPVEVSALINLMTCREIKLMSGRIHDNELEWVTPGKPSALARLFFGAKEREPYLRLKDSIWCEAYESVEEFNEVNYPKCKANEDLSVDHNPCIVIFHGEETTNIYYDNIEEAERFFKKIKGIFEECNVPKLIKEDSALEAKIASMDAETVNKSLDLMQRLDKIDEDK